MKKTTSKVPVVFGRPLARLSPARRKALLAKREAWLREIDPTHLFHRLFDVIPGVYFFAKNKQGEMMFFSQGILDLYHITDEAAVIGMTDFDLNPVDMAQSYVQDDARIYATGKPLLNRVELWFDRFGMPDWSVVNKMLIRSRTGKVIGIMGCSQSYEERAKLLQPFQGISKAVNHFRQNYHEDISIRELARLSGLSPRQLERKFRATFGVSPQQFLIKTRLLAACRALRETIKSLAEIAFDSGFGDQSAFTRHFRRHIGMTPGQFRRKEVVK
ncbi:MAG: helix-turn-helix domain-containing protein [Kiritimatiellae bacterium]|nr:helix-turn-helix domain-containing protein [Kiritimatiellia bacterium]